MNTSTYLSLLERIRIKAPIVKDINLYNGQYTDANARQEDPFNTPAVFIEFGAGAWEQMHPSFQLHNTSITVHVVESTYKRTRNMDKKSPAQAAIDLEHLRTAQKVHEALQRWMPEGCVAVLERADTQYDQNYDQLLITRHTYATVIEEERINPTLTEKVVLEVKIVN